MPPNINRRSAEKEVVTEVKIAVTVGWIQRYASLKKNTTFLRTSGHYEGVTEDI